MGLQFRTKIPDLFPSCSIKGLEGRADLLSLHISVPAEVEVRGKPDAVKAAKSLIESMHWFLHTIAMLAKEFSPKVSRDWVGPKRNLYSLTVLEACRGFSERDEPLKLRFDTRRTN